MFTKRRSFNPARNGSRLSAMRPLLEYRFTLQTARKTGSAAYTSHLNLVGVRTSRCRPLDVRTDPIKQCRLNTSCSQPSLAARSGLAQPSLADLAVLAH